MKPKPKDVDVSKTSRKQEQRQPPFPEPTEPDDQLTGEPYELTRPSELDEDQLPTLDTVPTDPAEDACNADKSASATAHQPPVPGSKPVLRNQTLSVGEEIVYFIPPNGLRVVGTVKKVPPPQGGYAEIRTPGGEIRSFNPNLVPWQHLNG